MIGRVKMETALSVLGVVFIIIGPLGAHLRILPPMAGFTLFLLSGPLGLAGAATSLFFRFVKKSSVSLSRMPLLGLLLPLFLCLLLFGAKNYPPINDVSTDLDDIPIFVKAPALAENEDRDFTFPATFKSIVRVSYPDLAPKHLQENPVKIFEDALRLLKERRDISVTRIDRDKLELEGVVESSVFRFKDDFLIRLRSSDKGTLVDMRSKSRSGRGDIGENAKRIRTFLGALERGAWN